MKKRKQLLAFCLVTVMVLGLVPSVSAVTSDSSVTESQIEFLTAMKFMEPDSEESFGTERLFRRGEFAELLCTVMGISPAVVDSDELLYGDITGSNPYAGYIKTVVELEMMEPDEKGWFWPGEAVSLEDACRALVNLQGGKVLLEVMPPITAAFRVNIIESQSKKSGKLTKGDVAELLYSTLHTEYYKQIIYGVNEEYERPEKYYVLEELCNIVYRTGIVDGENGTTLTGVDESLYDGIIRIDGKYYSGAIDDTYLGYAVRYYYRANKTDAPMRELVYIQKNERLNQVLTIEADLIQGIAGTVIEYAETEDSNRIRRVNIPGAIDMVYNGVAYPTWTSADLNPDYGQITLIDNNDDRVYDVALVEDYTFMVVGYADSNALKVYDHFTGEILDLSQPGIFYEVRQQDGTEVKFYRGVRAGRLLAIMKSKNTTGPVKYTLISGDEPVTGEITAMSGRNISLGGVQVKLAYSLYNSLSAGTLKLGKKVAFYMWNDNVVRIEDPESTGLRPNVAYLVDVAEEDEAFGGSLKFRLVSSGAAFEDVEGAEKITVDGIRYSNTKTIADLLKASARLSRYNASFPYAQPVQVWKNDDGKINKIDTVTFDSANETKEESLVTDIPVQSAKYSTSNRSFYTDAGLLTTVPATVPVFWIPQTQRSEEEFYGVVTNGGGLGANTYTVEPFFVQDNYVAEAVFIYYAPLTTVAGSSEPYVIIDIVETMDEDGELLKELTSLNIGGATVTMNLPDDLGAPELKVGDVFRRRNNYAGKMQAFDLTFSPYALPAASNRIKSYYKGTSTDVGATQIGYASAYGTVLERKNGVITLTTSVASDSNGVEEKANLDNYLVSDNTQYYKIEMVRNEPKVTFSSFNALMPYSTNPDEASEVVLFVVNNVLRVVYEIELN